jgi:tetratricopeptide (TPR) repeat protein
LLQLCVRNHIDPTDGSSTGSGTTPPAVCDADALKEKGMENVNIGQHAAALQQFEASLRCKSSPQVVALAFMESCNAQDVAKARLFYQKLSASDQTRLKAICIRNRIDLGNSSDTNTLNTVLPANCDADALKDKGMENVNMGQHAAALQMFEASLRCKQDSYVLALAFMASCNAQDGPKAKLYYAKLSPKQQSLYRVMCDRNKIDVDTGELMATSDTGYLEVTCQPEAKVLIDGKDTGLTTPVKGKKLPLAAGKHKLTLVVGADRFTYPTVIEAGKTVKMSKDLR